MVDYTPSLAVAVLAFFVGVVALVRTYRAAPQPKSDGFNTKPLQLQAYERLVILCERISLPNLISRTNNPNLSVREMQFMLVENIKQEFEYNASQQIYVSQAAWDSVRNLRDQTLLIINSIARTLSADATAHDLNKGLLEAIINQDNTALHTFTLNTLNDEAKKVM
ncbi:MAG TPA: hypothetical protein VM871_03705 [Flavisolibacter sp.]|jgi:hypothetical protein|nr:hypothetical protein [Flavisolibacter sp.]